MPAPGLSESNLTGTIMNRLKAEVGASEKDLEENDTLLAKVATILAEEVIREIKQAKIAVQIPAGQVIITVSGGSGAPAIGVLNPTPIQADNSISGGIT